MATPSVTWTFANSTTSDATQVNTNFTNIINALADGTADLSIGTLTAAGAVTFNGAVTLGNATADDLTFGGSVASSIPVKTNATYNFGTATAALLSIYLGNGTKSTRILAGTVGTSWTLTLPNDAPTITGQGLVFDTAGTASFRYPNKFTASKTTTYLATGDETVVLCDSASAAFTVTLPAASTCAGKELTIVKTNSDLDKPVTIDGNSTELIIPSVVSGQQTYLLYTINESVTIRCNGTSWYVVSHFCNTQWVDDGAVTITGTTTNPTKGTVQTDQHFWRRVGNCMEGRIAYRHSTAGAAGSGDYLWLIPQGASLTIDVNFLKAYTTVEGVGAYSGDNVVGVGWASAAGTASGISFVEVYDSTHVRAFNCDAGNVGAISSGWYNMGQTNICHMFSYSVPITGWNP